MARGQKICPECALGCGPRTKICKGCQHVFAFASKTDVKEKLENTLSQILDGTISVKDGKKSKKVKPIGRPITFAIPMQRMKNKGKLKMVVPPKSFTDEGIMEWASAMNDYVCPSTGNRFALFVVFQYLEVLVKDKDRQNLLRGLIREKWVYWKEEVYGLPTMQKFASK